MSDDHASSPLRRLHELLAPGRFTSTLRFALTVLAADLVMAALFGSSSTALFGSYAAVALLLFGDFDGSLPERSLAFGIASIVGLAGLVVGVEVAPALGVSVAVMFAGALCLSLARSMYGNVARGVIGAQLAFLIAVMSPAPRDRLASCMASWLLGAGIASAVGIFVFPRHHTGAVRRALGTWCEAAAELAGDLAGGGETDDAVKALIDAWGLVDRAASRLGNRPGWLGRETRVLSEMIEAAQGATSVLRTSVQPHSPDRDLDRALTASTVGAFRWCAAALESNRPPPRPAIDLEVLRSADLAETVSWVAAQPASALDATLSVIERHHMLRVVAVLAIAFVHRTDSLIDHVPMVPDLAFPVVSTPHRVLLTTFSARSLWFRHGIQSAVGMAAAVWIARSLGTQHSFWIVMTTLGLLNGSFNASATGRGAIRAGLGTALGVAGGAALLSLHPPLVVLGLLVPIAAFATKWLEHADPIRGQAAFTVFSLVNTVFLGWPSHHHVAEARLIDVLIGLGIAVGAMTLVYPGGTGILLRRCAVSLRSAADDLVESAHRVVSARAPGLEFTVLEEACADEILRYSGTLSAVASASPVSDELTAWRQLGGWGRQCLMGSAMATSLAQGAGSPTASPQIAAALCAAPGCLVAHVVDAVHEDPAMLHRAPASVVSGLWAAAWLDHLAGVRPAELPDSTSRRGVGRVVVSQVK